MTCNCMTVIDKKLAEGGHNTKISRTFTLGEGAHGISMFPTIATELVEKKRGAKPLAIRPGFCPFCGVAFAFAEAEVPA